MLRYTLIALGVGAAAYLWQRRQPAPAAPDNRIIEPPVAARVTRQPNGDLYLTWQREAETVRIFASSDPTHFPPESLVAEVTQAQEITLSALEPSTRYYFRLQFEADEAITVAERFLPFEEGINFRDIGGYRTRDGRVTQWGRVYRAGYLFRFTEADTAYLDGLGLKMICDLRTEQETRQDPDRLSPEQAWLYRHTPIYRYDRRLDQVSALLFKRNRLGQVMQQNYIRAAEERAHVFGELLRYIADGDRLPLLLHCTAGKDRTGMLIALLLSLLGVPEETIIADYTLSNREYQTFHDAVQESLDSVRLFRIKMHEVLPIIIASPEIIRTFLTHLRTKYGSVEAYLLGPAGLDEAVLSRLRENLLE